MHCFLPFLSDFSALTALTDGLVGKDVEDEDVQCMVACINKELFEFAVVLIDPVAEVIGHQESQDGRNGEGEELWKEERQFMLASR